LQRSSSVYYNNEKKLLRMGDHGYGNLTSVLNKAHWRRNMDVVVLELMRRRITEGLAHFANVSYVENRDYVVECGAWEKTRLQRPGACILYLAPSEESSSAETPSEEMSSESALVHYAYDSSVPPRFSTIRAHQFGFAPRESPQLHGEGTLPEEAQSELGHNDVRPGGRRDDSREPFLVVHDLSLLLGGEHVQWLREECKLFQDGALFLLHKQATVNLRMLLWKLEGYMAPKEADGATTENPSSTDASNVPV
jgi:hypothetical protein